MHEARELETVTRVRDTPDPKYCCLTLPTHLQQTPLPQGSNVSLFYASALRTFFVSPGCREGSWWGESGAKVALGAGVTGDRGAGKRAGLWGVCWAAQCLPLRPQAHLPSNPSS